MSASLLRAQIETRMPSALALYKRPERSTIPAGIPVVDEVTGGIPKHALTEICGVGKTSVLVSRPQSAFAIGNVYWSRNAAMGSTSAARRAGM